MLSALQDFEILVDDDNGPTPAPAAAPSAAVSYPKPPAAPGAAAGGAGAAAAAAALTASGRLSSTHLHYVRPGLEPQGSLGSASLAAGQQQHPHMMPHGQGGPDAGAQRQGSVLSGFGGHLGPAASQQYSLPLPGVGHQLPGPPAVPGPRPPAGNRGQAAVAPTVNLSTWEARGGASRVCNDSCDNRPACLYCAHMHCHAQ